MSSSSWAEEAQFTATLNGIKAPSGSKIKRIAELAVEHSRHYKHIVYAVERLVRKAHSTPQTIAGLYCIDAIVRHSRHSHSSQQPDVYVVRFSQHLAELLLDVVERCGHDGKEVIRKLCRTWRTRGVFDSELLDRMLDEVGDEEADEEGTEEERDRKRKEQQAETDSEDEGDERKGPEPAIRQTAQPPPPRPRSATVPPPSQPGAPPQPHQPTQQQHAAYYPPQTTAPLLPTPPQLSNPVHARPQPQQSAYPPAPAAALTGPAKVPSYAAFLGDDDDEDDDDDGNADDRMHKMRQRLEAEKLKLSQPTHPIQPTQPPPPPTPAQQPPQPPPSQSLMSGQSGYEYEQKRSRFGAPKSRNDVEAAMAAHGGPADGGFEQYRPMPPTAAELHRSPSNSFSTSMSSPPSAATLPSPYAPPPPPASSFDTRPRHVHSGSMSSHPGLQLSSNQSDCPPGLSRVVSTVLFIGHGKLETSSASLADWMTSLTSLCQPHGQLAAIRYVPSAGAHFATFATRGQAEAAVIALHRTRVLDRELKLGWGKSKGGIQIQQFDNDTGEALVGMGEAARLEMWSDRVRSVSDLVREQGEQRSRGGSADSLERGPAATPAGIPGFSPPAQYPPQLPASAQPFSPPSMTEVSRSPFHHPSRPPPAYEPAPVAAAPPVRSGPSPSVAAFLASVLPPAAATTASPSFPPTQAAVLQQNAGPPQQAALLAYPSNTQYPPPTHPAPYAATVAPYVPPPAAYAQNGHGSGGGAVSDPWEARKRLRWDDGQQSYTQQQQQQMHGSNGGYPPN